MAISNRMSRSNSDHQELERSPTFCRKTILQTCYGVTYTFAMYFSNFSLQYVSYPTQALAKSCKPLPVFFSGFFVPTRKYRWTDYCSIGSIMLGITIYNYFKSKSGGEDAPIGLIFLFLSLLLNGFSGYFGDNLKDEYAPSNWSYMRSCNLVAMICLFIHCGILLAVGFYNINYIDYFHRYPNQLTKIIIYASFSALGQVFIFRAM